MDYSSFKDQISSFIPNFLLFHRARLLSSPSDRNHPVYSNVQVEKAPSEPKNGAYGFEERLSQAQKNAFLQAQKNAVLQAQKNAQCYDAFTSQTNFLFEYHYASEADEMQYLQSWLNNDVWMM